jgi:hypothetical protein
MFVFCRIACIIYSETETCSFECRKLVFHNIVSPTIRLSLPAKLACAEHTGTTMHLITQAIDIAGDTLCRASKLLSATSGELLYQMGLSNPPPPFPKFLDLPTELRRQIWRDAFPAPRIVELVDGPGRTGRLRAQQLVTPWITPATPPVVLYVCRESRSEALRYYQLAFGRNGFEPRIYIDFARDIVYFGRGTRGDGTVDVDDSMQDFEKIRNMAVTPNCLGRLLNWVIGRRFVGLREIYLVNLRTYSMRVPPRLKEIESRTPSQSVEAYSQRLEELQDNFERGVAPALKVAIFMS